MTEIKENTKIEIRPIENRGNVKAFSKNISYFAPPHTIAPLVDPKTRRYATGLSEEDVEYLKKEGFPYDISDSYMQGRPHEFWESSLIKVDLKSTPMFLYPGKSLIDFCKYKFLKVSRYVYSSEEELKRGTKPQATHYIYDESVEISLKANKLELLNKVTSKLSQISLDRKKDIILILEDEDARNKGDDYFTVKFHEMLKDPQKVKDLNEILDRKVADVGLEAEIKRAIGANVLRRTKKGIFFFETNLGHSIAEVKDHLGKPENQELYLQILEKL